MNKIIAICGGVRSSPWWLASSIRSNQSVLLMSNNHQNNKNELRFPSFPLSSRSFTSSSSSSAADDNNSSVQSKAQPNPPKRPPSGYILFLNEVIKNRPPESNVRDAFKRSSEQWAAMSDYEKQAYVDKSQAMKQRYQTLLEDFKTANPGAPLKSPTKKKANTLAKKINKLLAELEYPKKPLNAFMTYLGEKRQEQSGSSSSSSSSENAPHSLAGQQQSVSQWASEWRQLTEQERSPWADKSGEARARYQEELAHWKEKMALPENASALERLEKLSLKAEEERRAVKEKADKKKQKAATATTSSV